MAYQVLARKWRPKRFSEMVGQQHVLKALENALNQDRLHHAYLFTGTRGVGKTTIARIFAKCLNCERGVSSEPCGTCSVCTSIDEGRFLDLMEIDAASHTGVDSIRDLLDNTQYSPSQGKYKVYLIDEVHMLSSSSFNALLKTLEEPPEHVKFLLATTDPQKLPVTVLSRCLQFNLKAMSPSQIAGHLKLLLEKEMISFDEEALELIAQSADGSMRDALSLCDQAIAHGNESLKGSEVRQMLGLVDRAYIPALMDALLSKDAKTLLNCVAQIASDSPNYQNLLAELISYLHRLIIEQVSDADRDVKVKAQAKEFTAEDLQLFYQIALKGRQDLSISPDQRQGLEICLLRMLLFRPDKLILPNNKNATPNNNTPKSVGNFSDKAGLDVLKNQNEKKNSELAVNTFSEIALNKSNTSTNYKEPETNQPLKELKQVSQPVKPSHPSSISSQRFSYQSIADKWTQIVLQLNLSGPVLMVAKNANLEKLSDKSFQLVLDKKFEMLATQQTVSVLTNALSNFYGTTMELKIIFDTPKSVTPEQHFQALDAERSRFAEQSIMNDEVVKLLQEEFGAKIIEGSSQLLH